MQQPRIGTGGLRWFKSSHSGGSGTECLEVAAPDSGLLVRDSKRPSGPVVAFKAEAWEAFVAGVQRQAGR